MTKLSNFASSALALSLALAFPAAQAGTLSAVGSLSDSGGHNSSAKSANFNRAATSGAFSEAALGVPENNWDSFQEVKAASNGLGQFGASVSVDANCCAWSLQEAITRLEFNTSLTNTSSFSQDAQFSLKIDALAFAFRLGDPNMGTFARAGFSAAVYVNGSSTAAWSSIYRAERDLNSAIGVSTMLESGTSLGLGAALQTQCQVFCGDWDNRAWEISNFMQVLNLGSVAANDSIQVRYAIELFSETNVYGGAASVNFSDPARAGFSGGSADLAFASTSTPVSEPGSIALLAGGLGLMAAAQRRAARRQRAAA